jgi:hypothetical protein
MKIRRFIRLAPVLLVVGLAACGGGEEAEEEAGVDSRNRAAEGSRGANRRRADMEHELPITIGLWMAAFTPVLILVVLLVGLRWSTAAAAKGIWDALFILYVVWPALILYQVARAAGAFGTIENGMERVVPSRLLIILIFSWVLSSFLQAYTGFGAPLAVVAPLMVGFGVDKIYAVLLPLLGRTWGNEFGSLGVAWLVTLNVAEVPDHGEMTLWVAMSPYLVLAVVAVVALLIPPCARCWRPSAWGSPSPPPRPATACSARQPTRTRPSRPSRTPAPC